MVKRDASHACVLGLAQKLLCNGPTDVFAQLASGNHRQTLDISSTMQSA